MMSNKSGQGTQESKASGERYRIKGMLSNIPDMLIAACASSLAVICAVAAPAVLISGVSGVLNTVSVGASVAASLVAGAGIVGVILGTCAIGALGVAAAYGASESGLSEKAQKISCRVGIGATLAFLAAVGWSSYGNEMEISSPVDRPTLSAVPHQKITIASGASGQELRLGNDFSASVSGKDVFHHRPAVHAAQQQSGQNLVL